MFKWLRRKNEPEVYALPTIPTKSDNGGSLSLFEPINSDSGAIINEETALRLSVVWSCLRVITESVAQLPRHVYQRQPNGRQIAREHPLYRLLHDAPNDYMTAFEFIETLVSHVALYGNAFAYIDRDANGVPVSIQPLLPDRTEGEIRNGSLIYKSRVGGMNVEFMPSDIIHVKGLGFDGLSGYSPIRLMRNDLGTEKSSAEFQAKFFASGSNMGGVISIQGKISPEAREKFKAAIQSEYQGNANAFKLLVLEEGAEFEKFGVSPEDGSLIDGRKLLIRKIAAAFKVPAHKVGDDSRTSYSSLEQENRSFYSECVNPYLRRFEDQFNLKLFSESERGDYYFEFNRMGFMQADMAAQTTHFHLMLQDRVYLPNEVREFYGMNGIEGGDKPLSTPNNNAPNPPTKGIEPPETEQNN